ncbi:MAG TPA: pyridoxamine 5'-phosphate oxidase family protein [Solirubrobacteraceae bacterium]|nr:pyridoxamine 5'-phosphate oxidase family protein [Solirubrobacteraceae bacterium]
MIKTPRTKLRRLPKRGFHDRETIDAILDEALICHLGFVHDGRPAVIPTLHARVGDEVFVHGSSASRMLRALATGVEACLTVTLVDGLVLARSAFHHSVNYRSVVLYGTATPVTEPEAKERALEAFTEKLVPGRWADVRWPSRKELKATAALSLPIAEGSAKVRTGPPIDDDEDYELDAWAGVVPMRTAMLPPEPDPLLRAGIPMPAHVRSLVS